MRVEYKKYAFNAVNLVSKINGMHLSKKCRKWTILR